MRLFLTVAAAAGCLAVQSAAAQATITVAGGQPGHPVSPLLWGIFFEDINLSADGGLYPELVRNRSFEDADKPEYWTFAGGADGRGTATIDGSRPLNPLNPHCLRIDSAGGFTLENQGYWGMNIIQGAHYQFNVAARESGGFRGPLTVKLLSSAGQELAVGEISELTRNWRYYPLELTAAGGDPKAKLQITSAASGSVFLDMVSLLPEKTWKNHGLRVDLGESLAALQPAFMRFPGGNWIEGDDLAHMYHWKTTIGDIDSRTPLWNTWGYNTTQGLGVYEYLCLCEDLGAEPLFGISCGMSLHDSVPLGQMGQWVQDALDAIEYANGPTNSVWGGLRAKAGHPAPFHLKYLEIGNENGGPDYAERWALLVNAIRARYPEMQLIMTTDLRGRPYPSDPQPDIIDEHYYESPESFMNRADQYDHYNRQGPKIFVGEYAVTQNAGKGNLRAAVGEAAFMTGLERNSDIVALASYAPLFVNLNHRAWNPDLINFDSSAWYGIPSYYAQQMFARNRGDQTVPVTVDCAAVQEPPPAGQIGVGTWNTEAEFKDIKVTAPDGRVLLTSDFSQNSDGWKLLGDGAQWSVRDGALRQTAERESIRALAGDRSWTDYTLELKARKLAGREGFLILFHIGGDEDRIWWNLGGWENTQDALEMDQTQDPKPSNIEIGRWYDLKLTVTGSRVQCWLDGKLVHDLVKSRQTTHCLYASATHDRKSGDLILKVVNAAKAPVTTAIKLQDVGNLSGSGQLTVLTSGSPQDENSLAEPLKVSPKTSAFQFQGDTLQQEFPGNSVNVLRFPSK